MEIYMGCVAGLGQGGLGGHLNFIVQAARASGAEPTVYTRLRNTAGPSRLISAPIWSRAVPYSPLRWRPGTVVNCDGLDFDRRVAARLPKRRVVYHSFPGFAERSFQHVKAWNGVTVLESATVHVMDLVRATNREHRLRQMGGNPFSKQWTERALREYALADYITVASTMQLESFLRHGIARNKLLFTPLGVDTARFTRQGQAIRTPGDPFNVVQVGQVSLLKGIVYLLEALDKLNDPGVKLTLFGGIGWRAIHSLVADYQRRGVNVHVESGNPVAALNKAHVCVHASLTDGFGFAPLEAMSMSVPVIVTEGTGMKEIITPGREGEIVPCGDAMALAQAIRKLQTNEVQRRAMAQYARETALEYDQFRRMGDYAARLWPVWSTTPIRQSG